MLELHHPWIDTTAAPLYVITAPPRLLDDELTSLLSCMNDWYQELDHSIAFVVDLSALEEMVSFRQQAMMSAAERRTKFQDFKYNRGQAFVVTNPLVRGLVNVIWTVSVPVYPHAVFRTKAEAVAWATARLKTPASTSLSHAPPR